MTTSVEVRQRGLRYLDEALTVVIEQQSEKFRPSIPLESGIRLSQELAGMDQRPIFVEQVHVLSRVSIKRVGPT